MSVSQTLFPLELVLAQVPLSQQANAASRQRWKTRIADAARSEMRAKDDLGFIDARPLAVTIYYFPPTSMQGDVDNIVKPILDALVGQVFLDDRQVERLLVQKFEPEADWELVTPSPTLAKALEGTLPFVYIRIEDDLTWRTI